MSWSLVLLWDLAFSGRKARVGALRPVSPADPAAAQQALRAGGGLGEEEQEAAAATPEEHGSSRRGAGAAADPLREGGAVCRVDRLFIPPLNLPEPPPCTLDAQRLVYVASQSVKYPRSDKLCLFEVFEYTGMYYCIKKYSCMIVQN